jgi:hypothetical protein
MRNLVPHPVPKKKSHRLKGVERKLGDSRPLHFFVEIEDLGLLGAAQRPDEETDWERLHSMGFRFA